MKTVVAKTPEGIVVRIITPSGECSYRKSPDGSWAICGEHKGPWVVLREINVPKTAVAAASD